MRVLSEEQRRQAFFYAQEGEAELYDDIVDLTQRDYREAHRAIVDLLRYHFTSEGDPSPAEVAGSILDAGCGTGIEGISILSAFPRIRLVGLDFNPAMLSRFTENYRSRFGAVPDERRCLLACVDLLSDAALAPNLRQYLPPGSGPTCYRAVVTAFALHHCTADEKKRIYSQFWSLLPPGGLFLNADLFAYRSAALDRHARNDLEGWIVREFARPSQDVVRRIQAAGQASETLRDRFIEHIRNYNAPLPVEPAPRSSTGEVLAQRGEMDLLSEVGFREISCPYRYYQCGILWATK